MTRPSSVPTVIDVWFRAAAVAGRWRGTLAKMMAVRMVVPMTKPAPMARKGMTKKR